MSMSVWSVAVAFVVAGSAGVFRQPQQQAPSTPLETEPTVQRPMPDPTVQATNLKELVGRSLWLEQVKAVLLTIGWSVAGTVVIAFLVKAVLGLRADRETEEAGLDQSEHGEVGYHFDEAGG